MRTRLDLYEAAEEDREEKIEPKNIPKAISKSRKLEYEQIEKLVVLTQNGNQEAFQELYEATARPVYYMIRKKLANDQEAEDLLQEIYIQVYKSIHLLKKGITFVAWLNKIASCKYADYVRSGKGDKAEQNIYLIEEDEMELNEEFLPEQALLNAEFGEIILETVNSLPDLQRMAIFMFYYEGMTTIEISKAQEISEGVVRKRLHDGRKKIKSKLLSLKGKGVNFFSMSNIPILTQLLLNDVRKNVPEEAISNAWRAISTSVFLGTTVAGTTSATVGTTTATSAIVSKAAIIAFAKSTAAVFVAASVAIGANMYIEQGKMAQRVAHLESVQGQTEQVLKQPLTETSMLIEKDKQKQLDPNVAKTSNDSLQNPHNGFDTKAQIDANLTNAQDQTDTNAQLQLEDEQNPLGKLKNIIEEETPLAAVVLPLETSTGAIVLNYELGEDVTREEFLKQLHAETGNKVANVNVEMQNFKNVDFKTVGEYEVVSKFANLANHNGAQNSQTNVLVKVQDTTAPKISVKNFNIKYPRNSTITTEQIIKDANITTTDNQENPIGVEFGGFEKLDTTQKTIYCATVNATDASGNVAKQEILFIEIE